MKTKILVLTLVAAAGASAAYAQEDETALETVVITAGRTPEAAEKVGRAYTVITAEELEEHHIQYVSDALRLVPGVAVSQAGSRGSLTQVRIRGTEANHVLVLIDGIEASETSTDGYDFSNLQTAGIERIEVLRGPQSAFWGSDAVGGVINIITKTGMRNGHEITAKSEVGTDGTVLGSVSLLGGGETFDAGVTASYRRSDGYNISPYGDEDDGDRNFTLNGKFNADITPDLRLDGSLRFVDRKSDYDAQDFSYDPVTFAAGSSYGLVLDTDNQTDTQDVLGQLGLTWTSLDGALTQETRVSGNHYTRDELEDGDEVEGGSKGGRTKASYQASYAFDTPSFADAHHQLTGGIDWERETFQLTEPRSAGALDDEKSRETYGFVGEYRGEFFDQLYLDAAVRHDLNDDFADATTFSLSGAWEIPNADTRLHSSVGTGVTNPTFTELYGYYPAYFVGNPDLEPEESFGWDVGIGHDFADGLVVADLTYFHQDLENEIYSNGSTVINMDGTSKRQGIEASLTINPFPGFSATATYTYTDAEDPDGDEEVRRAPHSGSLNASYQFYEGRARVFLDAVFNGEMKDYDYHTGRATYSTTTATLDSYTVVNLGGSYKFTDVLEGYARVENLFDEEYQEVYGYEAQGRTAFVGLKATF
ncbi:TonB-dependent receptor plug domain-containing protein [Consotaella aegiceratis]|uniref:TonB-dependent receptor plug domain-containing protein n=1 Tax=Consotaella aegiceratis TaxID=3097961 RepID=UPI002F427EA6